MKSSSSCSTVSKGTLERILLIQTAAPLRSIAALLLGLLFVLSLACQGVTGEHGEQGIVGAPGPRGVTGLDGVSGVDGPLGPVGPQGIAGPAGIAGLAGDIGPAGVAGPAGKSYTEDEVLALIDELLKGLSLDSLIDGDATTGGLLFDNWPVVTGIEPEGEHGLWGVQSTNLATGVATWRCSECHGWDYKGAGGMYATGEHYTGFPGLVEFSRVLTQTQVLEFLHGGVDARHDFTKWLTDEQMLDLSAFVKTEIINLATYVDYETLLPREEIDADRGALLYGRTCAPCHGSGGANVDLGYPDNPLTLSEYSKVSPFATIHKIRFGQPGVSGMPAVIERGWSTNDVIAVLGYVQSLEP